MNLLGKIFNSQQVKKLNYLRTTLRKEVKDLYKENCKAMKWEIEEDTSDIKTFHVPVLAELVLCSWVNYLK